MIELSAVGGPFLVVEPQQHTGEHGDQDGHHQHQSLLGRVHVPASLPVGGPKGYIGLPGRTVRDQRTRGRYPRLVADLRLTTSVDDRPGAGVDSPDRFGDRLLSGRYQLRALIGTGASATVHLADDVTLGRPVAVKLLHEGLANDDAFLRRFRGEARAAAALNHPNITAVFDWGEADDSVPFLVMELLAGGSLRTLLDRHGTRSVAQTLVIGLEAARGPRLRPSPRLRPPRREAGQPAVRRRGPAAHRRLRSGPGPGRGGLDRAGQRRARHGQVRLARAGHGRLTSTDAATSTRWPSC